MLTKYKFYVLTFHAYATGSSISMRYKQKSMNKKALDDSQSRWMILSQRSVLRRQVLWHLACSTKEIEQLLDPQVRKTIIRKVTSIGLVNNSCHSVTSHFS